MQGTIKDEIFGGCLKCGDIYNCENCDEGGCISCDNGTPPSSQRRCPKSSQR